MRQRSKLSRLLSLALCLCMVLAMLPALPLTANAASTSKIYLVPNSNWTQSNAWFAAYFFNNGEKWVKMTDADGNGIYECEVPSGFVDVIFCRMNSSASATNWNNVWNQTNDLKLANGNDLYTIASGAWSKGNGTWSKATCDQVFHNMVNGKCTRSGCTAEERTVYFQNNWEWQDVYVYYWKDLGNDKTINNGWPGVAVDYYDKDSEDRLYSVMTVPNDVDGFIINGTNNSNTGTNKKDQTVTITMDDWYDGITYYLDAFTTETDGHHVCEVKDYVICKDFSKEHKYVNDRCSRCDETYCQINGHKFGSGLGKNDTCERCGADSMTIFFKSTWGWSDVCLYEWYEETGIDNGWPGDKMSLYSSSQTGGQSIAYYYIKVPTDIDDVIVSGIKNDGTGVRDQSPNIPKADLYHGACIEMSWDEVNQKNAYNVFDINVVYQCILGHTYGETQYIWADDYSTCTATRTCTRNGAHVETETAETMSYQVQSGTCVRPLIEGCEAEFDASWAENQSTEVTYDVDPNNHIYGSHYVVNQDGTHVFICNACSVPVTEAEAHNHDIVMFAGNCQAVAVYRCSVCNTDITGAVNMDIHPAIKVKFDNGDGTHTEKWACCGTVAGEPEAHMDETEDGRCDGCHVVINPAFLDRVVADLKGKIGLHYYLVLSDDVLADPDAYVEFSLANGPSTKILVSEGESYYDNGEYYVFTYEAAVREMADVVYLQVYANGEAVFAEPRGYNVRAYAMHIMENYQDEKTQNLMESMVNFGAAAQLHFGYDAENLANNFLDAQPDYSDVTITGFDPIRGQGTEKVKLYSASLLLNSETTLRLFFTKDAVITLNGNRLKTTGRGGLFYVDITGIDAKDLDEDVTVVINDGTEEAEVTYNPMTYCQSIQNSAEGAYTNEMQDLVRALYLYNQAANAYFEGE